MNKEELENAFNETTDNAVSLLKENVKLKKKIDKAIETINYYAIEDENYSKIYNIEEKELLNILKGEDK